MNRKVKRGFAALGILVGVALAVEIAQGLTPKRDPFTGTDLSGKPWSLEEQKGHTVLVNFFSITCGPCQQEFPRLVEMQNRYGDKGLRVVVVAREDAATLRAIEPLAKAPVTMLADAGHVFDGYGIEAIPHTILFNEEGEATSEIQGYSEAALESLEEQLRKRVSR